jgi:hypothetical protein
MTLTEMRDWGGLRSRFLAALDPAEQARIFDLSEQTAQTLHLWAERYPLIRKVRIAPLSLSVAAAAPFASPEALVSTARLNLWIFSLDDLFDEGNVTQVELLNLADRYRATASTRIAFPDSDSRGMALVEVRDDLATYPLFELLGTEWADALSGTIDGMLSEYRWSLEYGRGHDPRAKLPSYAEYVSIGRYSVGGPPHIWAAVITADDASTPMHMDHLREMEKLASTCIRLANDLRSYEKEVAEGQINGLVILSRGLRDQGVSEENALAQAAQQVQADVLDGLQRLAELRAAAVTETGRPEDVIDSIARFVCEFYTHHDYHTFTGTGVAA